MGSVSGFANRAKNLRDVLRHATHRRRWEARVALRRALGLPPPEALARVMFEFARARRGALVVQIGSHDSSQLDPLRRYITTRGWRGVLVEPVPSVFERLRTNYAGVDGLAFENAAIAAEEGVRQLFYIPQTEDPGLPAWYDALASFKKDVLLSHESFIPDIADRIRSMDVPTVTFDKLCAKHGLREVDVIQIDTEGYDLEILRTIDFAKHKPTIVQFEELHMDASSRREARELLASYGFRCAGNDMDCLGVAAARLGAGDERVLHAWRGAEAELAARNP